MPRSIGSKPLARARRLICSWLECVVSCGENVAVGRGAEPQNAVFTGLQICKLVLHPRRIFDPLVAHLKHCMCILIARLLRSTIQAELIELFKTIPQIYVRFCPSLHMNRIRRPMPIRSNDSALQYKPERFKPNPIHQMTGLNTVSQVLMGAMWRSLLTRSQMCQSSPSPGICLKAVKPTPRCPSLS